MDTFEIITFLKELDKASIRSKDKQSHFKRGSPHILGKEWEFLVRLSTILKTSSSEDILSLLRISSSHIGAYELAQKFIEKSVGQIDIKKTSFLIKFSNRRAIKENLMAFKAALKEEIKRKYGIVSFAQKIGMKQANLSRLLSNTSMPDQNSLNKISVGLDLKELQISFLHSPVGQAFKKFSNET